MNATCEAVGSSSTAWRRTTAGVPRSREPEHDEPYLNIMSQGMHAALTRVEDETRTRCNLVAKQADEARIDEESDLGKSMQ